MVELLGLCWHEDRKRGYDHILNPPPAPLRYFSSKMTVYQNVIALQIAHAVTAILMEIISQWN